MGRPGPSEQDARAVAGGNAPWERTPLLSDGLPGLPAPPWVGLGLLGEVANKPHLPTACPAFLFTAGCSQNTLRSPLRGQAARAQICSTLFKLKPSPRLSERVSSTSQATAEATKR